MFIDVFFIYLFTYAIVCVCVKQVPNEEAGQSPMAFVVRQPQSSIPKTKSWILFQNKYFLVLA